MFGLTYLQQISDANVNAGLHIEPGLWVVIPHTSDPTVVPTVARLASIPHGTMILVQGTATTATVARTSRTRASSRSASAIRARKSTFPEQTLTNHTSFRTSGAGLTGVTQAMVDNPNSILQAAIAGQHITTTTTLHVTSTNIPVPGGGTANTAFLKARRTARTRTRRA